MEKRRARMKILESAENYLETILVLTKQNGAVRSIDIVNEMNFSKPSVSVAMKHFREDGYIVMDESGYITLTEKGMEVARRVYERHMVLTAMLRKLGVSEDVAAQDACRMEHDLSEETFQKIKEFTEKL
jgi:Mn-dependent DtxR family transcriptional regulator